MLLRAGALAALFDEPGLMLSRRRFFADVVDDKIGRYSLLGDRDVLGDDDSQLENAYEKVLNHAALRAALNNGRATSALLKATANTPRL